MLRTKPILVSGMPVQVILQLNVFAYLTPKTVVPFTPHVKNSYCVIIRSAHPILRFLRVSQPDLLCLASVRLMQFRAAPIARNTSPKFMDTGSKSDHEGTSEYQYKPLDETKREIRLLRVLPFEREFPPTRLYCQIVHAFLADRPRFNALSYVWGTCVKTCQIVVGSDTLSITTNLLEALQLYHAKIDAPSFLWVDAICINQNSITERNHQVGFMRDIFAQALRTIVWLGDFEFLPINHSWNFLGYIHEEMILISKPSIRIPDEELILQDLNTRRILSKPWFSRVWIVQELACSQEIVVQIGHETLAWQTLVDWTYDLYRRLKEELPLYQLPFVDRTFNIYDLDSHRQSYQYAQPFRLLYLVLDLRAKFSATREVDAIYALAGIASHQDNTKTRLPIDYRLPYDEVVSALLQHHSLTSGIVDSLRSASILRDMALGSDPDRHIIHTDPIQALSPRPHFAPFEHNWGIEERVPRAYRVRDGDCGFVSYFRGHFICQLTSSIGPLQLVYTNNKGTGRSPPLDVLIFVSQTRRSFYWCLELIELPEHAAKLVSDALATFERMWCVDLSFADGLWRRDVFRTIVGLDLVGAIHDPAQLFIWHTFQRLAECQIVQDTGRLITLYRRQVKFDVHDAQSSAGTNKLRKLED